MSIFPLLWAGIIAFCILMYVILDGFTLGTALLMPFLNKQERDIAISMLLPTWDGNQTWLVLGAASLYGAFPLAFSIVLPLLYLPLLVMVTALLFRGVVFEFRLKAHDSEKKFWDNCFILGSLTATFVQGIVLGFFIYGIKKLNYSLYPSFSWASLYAFFTGISLIFGYALLGATRLMLKTEGTLQNRTRDYAKKLTWIILFLVIAVSIWTPFVDPHIFDRWFHLNRLWILILLPALTFIIWGLLLYHLNKKSEYLPYYLSIGIFFCCFIGFLIGIWPNIVPPIISIWQAASPIPSLKFMLVGAAIMIPLLLFYTGYSYKVFSGKVKNMIEY